MVRVPRAVKMVMWGDEMKCGGVRVKSGYSMEVIKKTTPFSDFYEH